MVYCLSGKIGSGKSSVAESISKTANIPHVSFGRYIKEIAKSQNIEPNHRETLQEIGERLINKNINAFCLQVLNQINWKINDDLVIDGIRHLEVYDELKKILSPRKLLLIYIDADLETRETRKKINQETLKNFEKHSTERQVGSILKNKSDLIVDGTKDLNQIVSTILV